MKSDEELKEMLTEYEERILNIETVMNEEKNDSVCNELYETLDMLSGSVATLKYILEINTHRM